MIKSYMDSNMAIEGVILDNYYAGPNQVFTVDPIGFGQLAQIEQTKLHIVLGLQSGISSSNATYKYYDDLMKS